MVETIRQALKSSKEEPPKKGKQMTTLIIVWMNGKTDFEHFKSREEAKETAEAMVKRYNVNCYIADEVIYSKCF